MSASFDAARRPQTLSPRLDNQGERWGSVAADSAPNGEHDEVESAATAVGGLLGAATGLIVASAGTVEPFLLALATPLYLLPTLLLLLALPCSRTLFPAFSPCPLPGYIKDARMS